MQQGDVHLFQTPNDGEINIDSGIVEMTGGLGVSAYLSLFGGNEDDDGSDGDSQNWWANLNENEPQFMYRSETQNLLQSIPATTGNLLRISDAVSRDLAWMEEQKIANSIEVSISLPSLNTVCIEVTIEAQGEESQFEFTENWKAAV